MQGFDTLQRMFKYKAWSNDQLLTALQRLDDGGYLRGRLVLRTARRILSHTYVVDRIFAANLQRQEHNYQAANTAQVPKLAELSEAIRASDQWYLGYVAGLDSAQLAESIDFTFTDGAPGRMTREEMLMHLAMHGDYHRGQVSILLTKNPIGFSAAPFTGYLHKAEASARRR
jgi:uncharacterized damage-inducible protein DinB